MAPITRADVPEFIDRRFDVGVGTFMHGLGAAWLMVSQGAGPLLVALTQTASALPFFLLALPAGALGDIFDRRKLILATEVWMLSVATALAV